MLRQLRQKKVMKRILWGLAVIIIPAFVLWGAGSLGERRNYAGIIFGKKVSLREYVNAWEAAKNEALMAYGSKFYEIVDRLDLDNQAWDRLIMLREAKRKRIKVSDSEVISFISRIPFFLDKDGSFDRRKYEIILSNTFRRSPRKFEEDIRESLMIIRLSRGVVKDIPISEADSEEAVQKRIQALQNWRQDLYQKAALIDNIKRLKEEAPPETPQE